MSYTKLWLLIISQFLTVLLICFLGIQFYSNGSLYGISFIFSIIYFSYTLYFLIKEFQIIKRDKKDGIIEDTLVLCDYTVLYKGIERNNNIPPIPVATFKVKDSDKLISLGGDYSGILLKQGKKYRVKYYRNSEMLVSIVSFSRD